MMRFFRIWRLLHGQPQRRGFALHGSFALMQEFKDLDGEASRLKTASLMTAPVAAIITRRVLRPDAIDAAATERWNELMRRYEGVLIQMLVSKGIPPDKSEQLIVHVYGDAAIAFRAEEDARLFPIALWEAFEIVIGPAPTHLKAKLMLRAFVDELPNSEERGVLRQVAYDGAPQSRATTEELRDTMRRGCGLVHDKVTAVDKELDRLTDGTVRFADVSRWYPAQAADEYEAWLMALP
jgi:hypothetical protein